MIQTEGMVRRRRGSEVRRRRGKYKAVRGHGQEEW